MRYPFYQMTTAMRARLAELGATHFSLARNFDKHQANSVSSVHFFSGDKADDNGALDEVAYFSPDMHSPNFGPLSGFNEISRKNGQDVEDVCAIMPGDLVD